MAPTCLKITQTLLIVAHLAHVGFAGWSWINYDCVSPDGVSPSVTCKYTDWESNYIDVTTVDFWCCHVNEWGSNVTTVECPSLDECWDWDATKVKVNLNPDLLATTYAPPVKERKGLRLSLSTKLKIAGAAFSVLACIFGVLGWCCKRNRSDTVIYDQHDPIPLNATEQTTDPGYVAIDMNGDADQVPSYNEVTGTPKQDRITGPNNDTAAAIPTAPPASAYELPPPPTYEQVTNSGDATQQT